MRVPLALCFAALLALAMIPAAPAAAQAQAAVSADTLPTADARLDPRVAPDAPAAATEGTPGAGPRHPARIATLRNDESQAAEPLEDNVTLVISGTTLAIVLLVLLIIIVL